MDNRTPITVPTTDIAMENAQRCGDGARRRADLRGLIVYAGGSLVIKVDNALARTGVNIVSMYGAIEMWARGPRWKRREESTTFLRIFKEMSLVTAEDKPLLRVAKGTVAKKAAVKLYDGKSTHYKKRSSSAQKAETRLHRLPGPRSTWKSGWGASGECFDSVTFLRNRIMDALRPSSDRQVSKAVHIINQNVVFSRPTIKQLVSSDEVGPSLATPAIEQMIEKYSAELSEVHKSADAIGSSGSTRTGLTQAQLRFRIGRKIIPR
ncbi:hypothetical protein HWV62_12188 [Athelia sp. TMB]|nr:hypothetical protein HWV62_12188 [Athelia sp. TMB]